MIIRMDKLIKVIATALDIVEGELLGASTNHGKRMIGEYYSERTADAFLNVLDGGDAAFSEG
jgi:hypothetical protein